MGDGHPRPAATGMPCPRGCTCGAPSLAPPSLAPPDGAEGAGRCRVLLGAQLLTPRGAGPTPGGGLGEPRTQPGARSPGPVASKRPHGGAGGSGPGASRGDGGRRGLCALLGCRNRTGAPWMPSPRREAAGRPGGHAGDSPGSQRRCGLGATLLGCRLRGRGAAARWVLGREPRSRPRAAQGCRGASRFPRRGQGHLPPPAWSSRRCRRGGGAGGAREAQVRGRRPSRFAAGAGRTRHVGTGHVRTYTWAPGTWAPARGHLHVRTYTWAPARAHPARAPGARRGPVPEAGRSGEGGAGPWPRLARVTGRCRGHCGADGARAASAALAVGRVAGAAPLR